MKILLKLFVTSLAATTSFNAAAQVDHTSGTITGQAADSSYSVLHTDYGTTSTWNGVGAREVTAQQIKGYQMQQARMGAALTFQNVQRTRVQAVALADARQAATDAAFANMGVKNNPEGLPTHQVGTPAHLDSNATPQEQAEARSIAAVVTADARMALVDHPTPHPDAFNVENARAMAIEAAVHGVRYAGINHYAATGSINVGVSSLPGNTPVSVTVSGVTRTTTAAEIARVAPGVQVSIPHVDAIISSPDCRGSHNERSHHSDNGHGGNGSGNAAGTASAHGLGGGAHVGGGSSMGGGFHGNW